MPFLSPVQHLHTLSTVSTEALLCARPCPKCWSLPWTWQRTCPQLVYTLVKGHWQWTNRTKKILLGFEKAVGKIKWSHTGEDDQGRLPWLRLGRAMARNGHVSWDLNDEREAAVVRARKEHHKQKGEQKQGPQEGRLPGGQWSLETQEERRRRGRSDRQPGPDHARLRGCSTDLKLFLYVMEMPVEILGRGVT